MVSLSFYLKFDRKGTTKIRNPDRRIADKFTKIEDSYENSHFFIVCVPLFFPAFTLAPLCFYPYS